jgi:hypothetical protein
MALSHFDIFLLEATVPDETHGPLGPDCLYGLYTSWCLLHKIKPVADIVFRSAMEHRGINLKSAHRRMAGPAATDYILQSYPALG